MSTLDRIIRTPIDIDHEGLSFRGKLLADLRGLAVPEPVILAAAQSLLKSWIDARAEELRSQVATPGAGQAMEYQEVQAQAAAALKAPSSATAEKYPMLSVSIGVDIDPQTNAPATDVLGVARSVDAARSAWLLVGSRIRGVRLAAKKAIDEAATIEAAAAAHNAVDWSIQPAS